MPSRNIVKIYAADSFYHIYNRGVEKRTIFEDEQDYKVFLSYLREYLSPPKSAEERAIEFSFKGSTFKGAPRPVNNFSEEIELIAYCLMPNHFHFLLKQKGSLSIKEFMQSLATRYSMYFNRRYDRVGTLFQGIYKAAMVFEENYLLHLTRYLHLNPKECVTDIREAYSSYADYLGIRKTSWVRPEFILSFFSNKVDPVFKKYNSYEKFVETYPRDSATLLGRLILED